MSAVKKLPKITDPEILEREHSARESWHAFEIMAEFVDATERLKEITPAVSIFGSARTPSDHAYYKLTEEIARLLSDAGFSVISGGGPGIMEAANRGASDAGAESIGLNIVLPHEQAPNPYVTPYLSFQFHYFALRKMHFLIRARAVAVFPGGFGTFDEMFELLTLIQTGKMKPIPVLLFGKEFWTRVIDFGALAREGVISPSDLELITWCETAEDAWNCLRDFYKIGGHDPVI